MTDDIHPDANPDITDYLDDRGPVMLNIWLSMTSARRSSVSFRGRWRLRFDSLTKSIQRFDQSPAL